MPRLLVTALATAGLFLVAAISTTHAETEDKPAKVPTSHYVDPAKHIELDVPLSWERKWPENEDEHVRFIFTTGGKSGAGAQPPEFRILTTAKDDPAPKDLPTYAASVKKQATAELENAKFDADKESKVDGEKAVAFAGTGKTKSGSAKVQYVVTVHNAIGYSISFACDPATFDAEYAGAKPVAESVKWGK
jgi:hypothetical protein